MKEKLDAFVSEGTTARFSCKDHEGFYTGRICAADDSCFIAATVNTRGLLSGIRLFFIKDLLKIESDESCCTKTVLLDKKTPRECELLNLRGDLFSGLLNCIKCNSLVVTVNAAGSEDIYGYIKKHDGNILIIDRFDGMGIYTGITMIRKERVQRISVLGTDETIIDTLIKKRRMICT